MASFLWAFIEKPILEHRSLSIRSMYLQDFETPIQAKPRRAPGMAVQSWAALATAVVSITAVPGLCPRHWETHRSRSRPGEFEIDHSRCTPQPSSSTFFFPNRKVFGVYSHNKAFGAGHLSSGRSTSGLQTLLLQFPPPSRK